MSAETQHDDAEIDFKPGTEEFVFKTGRDEIKILVEGENQTVRDARREETLVILGANLTDAELGARVREHGRGVAVSPEILWAPITAEMARKRIAASGVLGVNVVSAPKSTTGIGH